MLKSRSCVRDAGADGSGLWILRRSYSVSSRSTSATASVSELSRLVTHTRGRPIIGILPIIDIGHFKNRFANNIYIFFLCKQTYYLQVTLFIGE